MQDTHQKIVVVSGGAGYVGGAIVRRLEAEGYVVAALYRADAPSSGHPYQCELSSPANIASTLDAIEQELGPLYAAVHAAGSMPKQKQLHQLSMSEVREQFEADVYPSFSFLSDCARRLKEHGAGVLIGITTAAVVSERNTKTRGVYSPTKFALQGMLAALREELAPRGVRVYSLAPGVMAGGLNKETPQAFLDMIRVLIPDKTLATPEDVAEKVTKLLSVSNEETALTILIAPECV